MSKSRQWDVYAKSLAYLGFGYPLWCPDTWGPGHPERRQPWDMGIGDVGWLRDGQFRPLIRTTSIDEARQPYHVLPPDFMPFDVARAGIGGNPDKIMQCVLHSRTIQTTSISGGLSASALRYVASCLDWCSNSLIIYLPCISKPCRARCGG